MEKFLPLLASVLVVFVSGAYLTHDVLSGAAFLGACGAIIYITTHTN